MFECIHCKCQFNTKKERGLHQRYCKMSPNYEKIKQALQNAGRLTSQKNKGIIRASRKLYTFICERCGKSYTKELTQTQYNQIHHYYCSRSCANGRLHSEEVKQKIGNSVRLRVFNTKLSANPQLLSNYKLINNRLTKLCISCGVPICNRATRCNKCAKQTISLETREKLRVAGLKAAQVNAELKRSKNEKLFYELCKNTFTNVRHNVAMFNGWDADIIIEDYKIAVLWNGVWHYKQIKVKQSLLQIQTRDKLKQQNIIACGYIPYIIQDMGSANPTKVNLEFEKFKDYIKTLKK